MGIKRRAALKGMLLGVATAAGARPASAAALPEAPADARGLLYDTTRCIGCKACVSACREANNLEPESAGFAPGLYHAPIDLSGRAKTVIKLYDDGSQRAFYKAHCLQCVDPACVGACMLGALSKKQYGIVEYNPTLCVGCRYCQMACPFNVPKFEWANRYSPKIVKCELCRHRFADGKGPACAEVCPREAVIYGPRAELLEEAHRRIAEHPGRYVPKVYGETDGGGTQALYLSHVPFDRLGLPVLSEQSVPATARTVQHTIYRGFVAPAALYALLGALVFRNRARSTWRYGEDEQGRDA